MQQQRSVQAAECNKIHQLEQWFFLFSAEGNEMQQLFYICSILLHLSMVRLGLKEIFTIFLHFTSFY